MALRITRSVDTIVYGGFKLELEDLEKSYDHRVWVRKLVINEDDPRVVLNITDKAGVMEVVLSRGESVNLLKNVAVKFNGVSEYTFEPQPYCDHCGRGDKNPVERVYPQARLGIDAPKKYSILRHDARKQ